MIARIRRPRLSPLAAREARWAFLFLSPWIVGFLAFTFFPMIATFFFTFTNIQLGTPAPVAFVGFDNYAAMIADPQVWKSLLITFKFAALALPVAIILPLAVALLLTSERLRGTSAFRVLFFLPYVVPLVAGVFIWGAMLNPETGWINEVIKAFGVADPPNWLRDTTWVYPALVIIGVWGIGGGIVVNMAGLRAIPTELYDAARVDGAGYWAQLRHVTLPLMSPVIFYSLILELVGVLQYFLVPLVYYNGTGDPGGTTLFFNLLLYKTFFTFQNMSYGATLAWLLFVVTLLVTLVVFRVSRRFVYYAGEVR